MVPLPFVMSVASAPRSECLEALAWRPVRHIADCVLFPERGDDAFEHGPRKVKFGRSPVAVAPTKARYCSRCVRQALSWKRRAVCYLRGSQAEGRRESVVLLDDEPLSPLNQHLSPCPWLRSSGRSQSCSLSRIPPCLPGSSVRPHIPSYSPSSPSPH